MNNYRIFSCFLLLGILVGCANPNQSISEKPRQQRTDDVQPAGGIDQAIFELQRTAGSMQKLGYLLAAFNGQKSNTQVRASELKAMMDQHDAKLAASVHSLSGALGNAGELDVNSKGSGAFAHEVLAALSVMQRQIIAGTIDCACKSPEFMTVMRAKTIEHMLNSVNAHRAQEHTELLSLKMLRAADAMVSFYLDSYVYLVSVRIENFKQWNLSSDITIDDLTTTKQQIDKMIEALPAIFAEDFDDHTFEQLDITELSAELSNTHPLQHAMGHLGVLEIQAEIIAKLPDPLSTPIRTLLEKLKEIDEITRYSKFAADHDHALAASRGEESFSDFDVRRNNGEDYYWNEQ